MQKLIRNSMQTITQMPTLTVLSKILAKATREEIDDAFFMSYPML